jgi:predicted enzyme related to lactoylglutathione lyase
MTDAPQMFRLNVEVGDLAQAAQLYGALFSQPTRPQAGARFYVSAGPVTLQVVETAPPHPCAKALYFTVRDLDAMHARVAQLGCLSRTMVHGQVGGEISVRPWGERSFYADDPWGNALCFVEAGTVYAG